MTRQLPVRTSIIIVSYNQPALLRRCLDSIVTHEAMQDKEIIVVDNNSSDPGIADLSREFAHAQFHFSATNLGFGKANNLAANEIAHGAYLLFLNPDAILMQPVIDKLIECLESTHGACMVGPRLLNPDGSLQYSTHGYPTLTKEFLRLVPGVRVLLANRTIVPRLLSRAQEIARTNLFARYGSQTEAPHEVEEVTGACFLMRKDTFVNYGGFDPKYFMYLEEADLCLRIVRSGGKIIYCPLAHVSHEVHGSRTGMATADAIALHKERCRSLVYFTAKNSGQASALRLRIVMASLLLVRILVGAPISLVFRRTKAVLRSDVAFLQVCVRPY